MIASFRMYEAGPAVADAWRRLFARVFERAGVAAGIVEHRWPDPIASLWESPDLACGFMCGWPFSRSPAMQAIVAPVPSPARYAGQPRYCSEFLVRADSGWERLEQTFGHRIGWMAQDSQSGFNAPRSHLCSFAGARRAPLYVESIGPLGTPARALDALLGGDVDVVALDSFYLDLRRRHHAAAMAKSRSVATTPWTPIPLLVAAPGIDPAVVARLRKHLLRAHTIAEDARDLDEVLVARFVEADVASYRALDAAAKRVVEAGYATIQ